MSLWRADERGILRFPLRSIVLSEDSVPPSDRRPPRSLPFIPRRGSGRGAVLGAALLALFALLSGCGRGNPVAPLPGLSAPPAYLGEWTPYRGTGEFYAVGEPVVLPSGDFLGHDRHDDRVIRLRADGTRVGAWPTVTDSSAGAPARLFDMRLGQDGYLYFLETRCSVTFGGGRCRHYLLRYDVDGAFRGRVLLAGLDSDYLLGDLVDFAVNATGEIYLLQRAAVLPSGVRPPRVLKQDALGRPLLTFGERGEGDGEFELPSALQLAPDGTLLVLDFELRRVQRFAADGRFLGRLVDAATVGVDLYFSTFRVDAAGICYLREIDDAIGRFSLDGAPLAPVTLQLAPAGEDPPYPPGLDDMAIDAAGSVMAFFPYEGFLVHCTPTGAFDYRLGHPDAPGPVDYSFLSGMVPAPAGGVIAVADNGYRLLRFDPAGGVTRLWESRDDPDGRQLRLVAADARGRIYLLDQALLALVELAPDGRILPRLELPAWLASLGREADYLAVGPDGDFYLGVPGRVITHIDAAGQFLGRVNLEADPALRNVDLRAVAVSPTGTLWLLDAGFAYIELPGGDYRLQENPRALAFDGAGALVATVPLDSLALGLPVHVKSLTFDGAGRMVIAGGGDPEGVVLVLDERGRPRARWGPGLAPAAAFRSPGRIAVDARDRLYLFDDDSGRLLRFDGTGLAKGRP